ncbi:extracellular solute-binding protein [Paenibacillus aurantius]|uniref:Extracellular solute-binding protein n=1 Tax=Paenibacillus aurantius TaxID=2918900 RepID=A0AA96RER5_9BACL|nr:extracellular solute-binding protein [Paenibacillus aurantius]WNQ10676.1 extracellular solute-binding protein [Paenibacillus aurantius]
MKAPLKAATLACVLTLITSSITACSSSKPSSDTEASGTPGAKSDVYENGLPKDQKVTLKIGNFEGGMGREWFDYAVKTFKEKYPNVSIDVNSSPNISQITQTKIAANDNEDMFDLFSGSIPGGITSYAESGMLEPQDDLWDRKASDGKGKTLKELAFSGTFESTQHTLGKVYSFPIAGSGSGLMYNKTLFEEKGWNQAPKTWSEFLQLCETIKASGAIPITFPGMYPDYINNGFGTAKLYELAEAKGNLKQVQDNYRNFKLPYYLAPENVERWNRIYEMGKKGYFPSGLAALNHTQSQMQVLQGKAAMVSTGTWVENEMKASTPQGFKWGFMTVPFGESESNTKWVQFTPGSGFLIWAKKPDLNKKWAKEFIVWLWSLDVQAQIAEKGGMLPLRADFSEDQARMAKLQSVPSAFLDYLKNNKVKVDSGYSDTVLTDEAYEQSLKLMSESIAQIATGKQEPLPKLQEAEALLKKAIEAQKK